MTHLLATCLEAVSGGRIPDRSALPADTVAAHRLEPLAGRWFEGDPAHQAAYHQTLLRGLRMAAETVRLNRTLTEAGCQPVWTRGVVHGATLYGDVGCRPATDLDVYVPPDARDRAEVRLRDEGFEPAPPRYPDWYYHRYHLQRPLRHRTRGTLLDLHWAVDHPLARRRVPLDEVASRGVSVETEHGEWRMPAPEDHVLMAIAHTAKESSRWLRDPAADPILDGDAPGRFLTWLDLALVLQRHRRAADPATIDLRARAWGLSGDLRWVTRRLAWALDGTTAVREWPWLKDVEPMPASPSNKAFLPATRGCPFGVRASRFEEVWQRRHDAEALPLRVSDVVRLAEAGCVTLALQRLPGMRLPASTTGEST